MSTRTVSSSLVVLLSLCLLSLCAAACEPPRVVCPTGFALSSSGRCTTAADAAAMLPGDGGPMLAGDAGTDDAGALADAGSPRIDACAWGTWFADADGDGFGSAATTVSACAQPAGTVADATDCDDARAATHPGSVEVCDGIDDDCDGSTDEALLTTYYRDADGDGVGVAGDHVEACGAPAHYAASSGDCDDAQPLSFPGNPEVCDGVDNDCDAGVDEGVLATFYADSDRDGFGTTVSQLACSAPAGFAAAGGDCDDTSTSIHPGATEVCDFVDQDCDGVADDGVQVAHYTDCDGDGWAPFGAVGVPGCFGMPPRSAPACASGGSWTTRVPATVPTSDCADNQVFARPGSTVFSASPAYYVGTTPRYDWNCDGVDTPRVTTISATLSCAPPGGLSTSCQQSGAHWAATAPVCGTSAPLYSCGPAPACAPGVYTTAQTCN